MAYLGGAKSIGKLDVNMCKIYDFNVLKSTSDCTCLKASMQDDLALIIAWVDCCFIFVFMHTYGKPTGNESKSTRFEFGSKKSPTTVFPYKPCVYF